MRTHRFDIFTIVLFSLLCGSNSILAADVKPGELLLTGFQGCYSVSLRFKEGVAGHDSYNKMKEVITTEKAGGLIKMQHVTIIDKDADGDDRDIVAYKAQLAKTPAYAPIRFPHLTETWEEKGGGIWKQTTYGPDGVTEAFSCEGSFTANEWSCEISNARQLRRDRLKKRTDFKLMDIQQSLVFSSANNNPGYMVTTQRNLKKNVKNEVVAVELGWIEYQKIDPAQCAERN